jgi:hypothetical protein
MSRNEEILQFTNYIFSEIGIGINKVKVQSEPLDQWLTHTDDNNKSDLTKHLEQSLTKSTPQTITVRTSLPVAGMQLRHGIVV